MRAPYWGSWSIYSPIYQYLYIFTSSDILKPDQNSPSWRNVWTKIQKMIVIIMFIQWDAI